MSPVGTMRWGNVVAPKSNQYGCDTWDVALTMGEEESLPLISLVERMINEAMSSRPAFPKDRSKLYVPYDQSKKKLPDGSFEPIDDELLWKFKRKTEIKGRNGELSRNTPPAIYDSTGRLCTDEIGSVGWGSVIKVVFEPFHYAAGATAGVSFLLTGIQIVQLEDDQSFAPPPIEGGFIAARVEQGSDGGAEDLDAMLPF